MRIAITGSSGLLGQALTERLTALGHEILALKRNRGTSPGPCPLESPEGGNRRGGPGRAGCRHPSRGGADLLRSLDPCQEGAHPRQQGEGHAAPGGGAGWALPSSPGSSSALRPWGITGIGARSSAPSRTRPAGDSLAETCAAWEAAAEAARRARITTLHLRIGMVLSPDGGALARMLPFFRFGLGGPLAGGDQYWSWIALPDLVKLIVHYLQHECESGPVNAVAPEPMRSRDFARTLGRVLHRPAFLPIPGFALKLILVRWRRNSCFASARALPFRAENEGFSFHPCHPGGGACATRFVRPDELGFKALAGVEYRLR